jgi:hypothetical protein
MIEWIGWKWLAEKYGIDPVQPFRITSHIGPSRRTTMEDGYALEQYPASFRPSHDLQGHLTFALKHEGIALEFLARLFGLLHGLGPQALLAWINAEATGQYARRAGFFYEWLTGHALPLEDRQAGNYVDAINADHYFVAAQPSVCKRWRVRDNLPGVPAYCPTVYRSESVRFAESYDCAKELAKLETEYGQDILMRSAVWLTIKESRASFAIEHEEKQVDRIQRFAAVMERRCGRAADPLAQEALIALQSEILGQSATRYGLRRSPVFVGHTSGYADVIVYIAPHWDASIPLLEGLSASIARTTGQAPIIRAAVASFGFVYIHPMADGNGRISRFLVNDILRRDGAAPAPFILPISAAITHTPKARAGYDRSLEVFSKPLLQKYNQHYAFGLTATHEDGITSNFHFNAYDDALPAWKYPDLTTHVEYLGNVIVQTITQEMDHEARFMRNLYAARREIKDWLEGPDADIDRIIRAVRENEWRISNKLRQQFPQLAQSVLAERIIGIVRAVFGADEEVDAGADAGADEGADAADVQSTANGV